MATIETSNGEVAAAPAVAEFQATIDRARDLAAERYEPELLKAYAQALRAAGRQAAAAFTDAATALSAAAGDPPKFVPPDPDEVLDTKRLADDAAKRTRKDRTGALTTVTDAALEGLGISFDVGGVMAQSLLEQAGKRVGKDLVAGARGIVVAAVERGLNEGLSVPQTAALIQEGLYGAADHLAVALARTDLVGIANGGSVIAARAAYPDGGIEKTWLATEDERTRDTHAEADGQTLPLDQPFDVGGFDLDYPGDPDGPDEEVINCRCTVVYAEPGGVTASGNGQTMIDTLRGPVRIEVNPESIAALNERVGQDAVMASLAAISDSLAKQGRSMERMLRRQHTERVEMTQQLAEVTATLVAAVGALTAVATAVNDRDPRVEVNLPPQQVDVHVPEQQPVVNVAAPNVELTTPEPVVNVHVDAPAPALSRKTINVKREPGTGTVTGYEIEEE